MARAVAHQTLEALAIPSWNHHRAIDRPTASVIHVVQRVHGDVIEMAVAMRPSRTPLEVTDDRDQLTFELPFGTYCGEVRVSAS